MTAAREIYREEGTSGHASKKRINVERKIELIDRNLFFRILASISQKTFVSCSRSQKYSRSLLSGYRGCTNEKSDLRFVR